MRKYLNEWDHDIFEMELAEQRLLDALNAKLPFTPRTEGYENDDAIRVKPRVNKNVEAGVDGGPETVSPSRGLQGVIPVVQGTTGFIAAPDSASTTEGYDDALDDANSWFGAEERERIVRGEQ